jgi:hypothetical protein
VAHRLQASRPARHLTLKRQRRREANRRLGK